MAFAIVPAKPSTIGKQKFIYVEGAMQKCCGSGYCCFNESVEPERGRRQEVFRKAAQETRNGSRNQPIAIAQPYKDNEANIGCDAEYCDCAEPCGLRE